MGSGGGHWLLSARTSRYFFASSLVVLMVGCLIVGLAELSSRVPPIRELSTRAAFYVPVAAVLILNALCAIFILVGMLWYWARFDDSKRLVKLLWLVSFLALGWYSTSIYYFVVYRSQRRLALDASQ